MTVTINGTAFTGSFPPTGGWDKWHNLTTFRDELQPGATNRISLVSPGPGIRLESLAVRFDDGTRPAK